MSKTPCRLFDSSFPTELVLEIVKKLPFDDGSNLASLSRAHSRMSAVLYVYQRSMTHFFMQQELRNASIDFPQPIEKQGYKWLKQCVKKYDIADEIIDAIWGDEWVVYPSLNANYSVPQKHNLPLVYHGLLFLYRLIGFEPHVAKLDYINSLSQGPLVAIHVAVTYSTMTAHHHSNGLLNQRNYGGRSMYADAHSLRRDIDFAFAEACLQLGPAYVHATMLCSDTIEYALLNIYHHLGLTKDWDAENEGLGEVKPPIIHGPEGDPESKEKSLWTSLLERLSLLFSCTVGQVGERVGAETTYRLNL